MAAASSGNAADAVVQADEICASCRRINIDLWADNRELILIDDVHELEQSHLTCPICRWLHQEFGLSQQSSDANRSNRSQIRFCPARISCGILHGYIGVVRPDEPAFDYSNEWLSEHVDDRMRLVGAVTNQGDPVLAFNKEVRNVRPIGCNTASSDSLRTARAWIESCLAGHPDQAQFPSEKGLYRSDPSISTHATDIGPTYLIDCLVEQSPTMSDNLSVGIQLTREHGIQTHGHGERGWTCRLIDGRDCAGPYAALSYRWGSADSSPWITTGDNISHRRIGLPEAPLPKTIREAIQITRGLHLRYLWVDAICIDQLSKEAWLAESGKMATVYENALVTICASSSSGSDRGIFNAMSMDGIEATAGEWLNITTIRSVLESGASSTLHAEISSSYDVPAACRPKRLLMDSTLNDRMWCCREAILSQRKLHFTNEQLYWECDHLKTSEDTLCQGPESWWRGVSSGQWSIAAQWYIALIENDYSRRRSKIASDRLIALSGLARRASIAFRCRYLAGIWADSLSRALAWKFIEIWDYPVLESWQSCDYTAPSWSWASQPRAVSFLSMFPETAEAVFPERVEAEYEYKLLEADIQLAGHDEFGAVTSGTLKLLSKIWKAHVMPCVMYGREQQVRINDVLFNASFDDDNGSAFPQDPPLMAVSTYFAKDATTNVECHFLLVQKAAEPDVYRRVGACELCEDPSQWQIPSLDAPDLQKIYARIEAMFFAKAESEIILI